MKVFERKRVIDETLRGKHALLLLSLVMVILFLPATDVLGTGGGLVTVFFLAVMISGLWSLREHRILRILGALLVLIAVVLRVLRHLRPDEPIWELIFLLETLPFFVVLTVITMHGVLGGERVTTDKLYGAGAVYFLLGFTWSVFYAVLETIKPGNFSGPLAAGADGIVTWSDFIYSSFTTLTTLGYGDIAPATYVARSLAILEASVGVLFVAILVARLVGLYQIQQRV